MTNADKFKKTFDIYATELWAMSGADFIKWLNADRDTGEKEQGMVENSNKGYPCISCCDPSKRMACCGCDKEAQWQAKYGKRSRK